MSMQKKLYESEKENDNEPSTKEGCIKDLITGRILKNTKEEIARQNLERMLLEDYGYPKEQMEIDFKIVYDLPKAARKADIAVFNNEKNKQQMNIYMIIEIDAPEKEIDKSAISFAATSATFYIWSNNKETLFFVKSAKNPIGFEEIQQIPRKGETLSDIGKHLKSQLKPSSNLKMVFENIHNQLYGSANMRRPEKLGAEMIKILFCKIYDERSGDSLCQFRGTVEELFAKDGMKTIANRIKNLFNSAKEEYSDVFGQSEELMLDDYSIAFIVSKIQGVSLMHTDTDTVGKAFEVFVPEELKGTKGEFFTARPVVKMSVEMINPSGLKKEHVIDPACGSGGFLISAMEKTLREMDSECRALNLAPSEMAKAKSEYVKNCFFGIDVEPDLSRISKAYMAIMGDGRSGIFCEDSLTPPKDWSEIMQKKVEFGTFDVVMTNPPFGTKIPITRKDVLAQFDLGKEFIENLNGQVIITKNIGKSQVPDILFLERCVQLLKPPTKGKSGGRMAIVLPRGILNNPKNLDDRATRKWLLEHSKLLAVVDLSSDTFQPYTGTKTSVVFCERVNEVPREDYTVFMAISREIGHDKRGNPKFKRDSEGTPILDKNGEMTLDIDTLDIANDYSKFALGEGFQENDRSFLVSIKTIRSSDRLDASFYNPLARNALEKIAASVPKGWQLKTIEEITKNVFFPARLKRVYVDAKHGVPFISGANITRFTKVGVKYLSKNTRTLKDFLVKQGWILITRSGTSGILVYADSSLNDIAVSDHVIRIIPDETKVNGGYLFAVLSSPDYAPIFKSAISGSVIDEITPEFIKKLKILIPDDRRIQDKIGKKIIDAEAKRVESMRLLEEAKDDLSLLWEK